MNLFSKILTAVGLCLTLSTSITLAQSPQLLEAEQRLKELGYWIGPIDGRADVAFSNALIAFQKVEGNAPVN